MLAHAGKIMQTPKVFPFPQSAIDTCPEFHHQKAIRPGPRPNPPCDLRSAERVEGSAEGAQRSAESTEGIAGGMEGNAESIEGSTDGMEESPESMEESTDGMEESAESTEESAEQPSFFGTFCGLSA
jgi:hypothetical protein